MKKLLPLFLLFFCFSISHSQIIEEIVFTGNKRIDRSLLHKSIEVAAGQKVDSSLIYKDIQILNRLNAVSNTSFTVERKGEDNYKLTYVIKENFTLIPSGTVFTTNNDEIAFRLGLAEFNLFGQNISLGGFYQKDIYDSYSINFRAPFLISRKMGVLATYQDLTTLEPVFLESGTANYKYNNNSYEAGLIYQFNYSNTIDIAFNYFRERYTYIEGETNPEVPLNLNVNKNLYRIKYTLDKVSFDYYFLDGIRNVFNFQFLTNAATEATDFNIWWNDFIYFKRLGEKGNLANRLRLGLFSNMDSPFAPFSVDNNLNIRGVGNTISRGTASVVLNSEYRHTLMERGWFVLQSNIFMDAGSWRKPGGDFNDLLDSKNFRVYPGVGLRLIHKTIFNAIFRIDYGYGITPDAGNGFVFGIGQYF